MQLATFVAAALSLASSVSAHGYLKYIDYAGVRYPAWQVGQDDFLTPLPIRYSRRIKDNGPVPDFTSPDITCNLGGNIPGPALISVSPNTQLKFVWDQWGSSHSGPVMTYLAKCPNGCANFKGDSGPVWVKIDQMGWDTNSSPKWASDKLATLGASWTVTIPPGLADGEYLIRHEILGLHVAGAPMGAQFYPSCAGLKVTGGGSTQLPSGIALPGAYTPNDAGILVELWRIGTLINSYTPPGGPVWSGAGAQLNGAGSVPAPTRTATWTGVAPTGNPPPVVSSSTLVTSVRTTAAATTTPVVRPTSTSTTPVSTPTPPPASGTVPQWGQCGGIGYSGPTGCVAPYRCVKSNDYYSQCLA